MADKGDGTSVVRRKKSFQGHQYRRKSRPACEQYSAALLNVAGLTLKSRCAFSCDEISGNIAFPAGCVIVVCQIRQKKQFHIFNPGRKQITCLQYSFDGQHLVTGESGHLPCVRVFSVSDRCQVTSFQSHKFGVSCVSFAPNSKYIVSIGFQHDNVINVWDWRKNCLAASNKVSIKVRALAFAENSSYFVTAGNRHVKFWYIEQNETSENSTVPLKGRSAILGTARNHMFCDVVCGVGCDEQYTFTLTRSGMICRFNGKRVMDKCTQSDAASAFCMCVTSGMIVCGCAESRVLLYSTTDLSIITVFNSCHFMAGYQDVIAVSMDSKNMWLHCIHANHSLHTWDMLDFTNPTEYSASDLHSECIWNVQVLKERNDSSFYTCSNDSTVRMWSLTDGNDCVLLKTLHIEGDIANTPSDKAKKIGVRSLCISEDGNQLAIGDRSGVVHIYEMSPAADKLQTKVKLHDGDILCLDGNVPSGLLASASRDRCIHMLDSNSVPIYTINDHSAAVTAVKFVSTPDRLRLITCSIDKSLYFGTVNVKAGNVEVVRDRHIVGKHAMHDMAVVNDCVLVACGSSLLEYDITNGKIQRTMKTNDSSANILRVTISDDASLVAVSCADKSVYMLAYQSGEYLLELSGHSEVCTALQFLTKNSESFLISASADSCIFVWKLSKRIYDVAEYSLQAISEQASEENVNHLNMTCYFGADTDVTSLLAESSLEAQPNGEPSANQETPGNIDFHNTSLPTWITGKSEKASKSRMPGGRWAGRVQEEDLIIPYEDILANQTLLDTPNSTQQWDNLDADDDTLGSSPKLDAQSPCLSANGTEDAGMTVPLSPVADQSNVTAESKPEAETRVPPLDLLPEDLCDSKIIPANEKDTHFDSILSQTLSAEYVSACEESEGENGDKMQSFIVEPYETPADATSKNPPNKEFGCDKVHSIETARSGDGTITTQNGIETFEGLGADETTIPNSYATISQPCDTIETPSSGRETNEPPANGETSNGPSGYISLEKAAEDFITNCGLLGTETSETPLHDGGRTEGCGDNGTICNRTFERLSGDGTIERPSDEGTGDKPLPPAFANFLDMAKKKQRTPRSLPIVKVHEPNFNGFSDAESVKNKTAPMKEVPEVIAKSAPSAQSFSALKISSGTSHTETVEDSEEIVQNLVSAFEKAESLYKNITSNGHALDSANDGARTMLFSTFVSLQSRMSKLGVQSEKNASQNMQEIDSPMMAMLREYSDKLLHMMEDKLKSPAL